MSKLDSIKLIDSYIRRLHKTEDKWMSLAIAIDLADEIMKGILPDNKVWQEKLSHNSQENAVLPEILPLDIFKTQKQQTWFVAHPVLGSARVAFSHFKDDTCPLESRLYWFSEKESKQKISISTQFLDNWEDSELTSNNNYKVGIDFFLSNDTKKLIMVLSNKQKLRVMEFSENLSNTQKQILTDKLFNDENTKNINTLEFPQEHIHNLLWNAFQLKEVNNKFYRGISFHYEELINGLIVDNKISVNDAKQFSSRLIGRLLFIWFLRKMELINKNQNYFNTTGIDSSNYYEQFLKPLFFQTLNKPIEERSINIQDDETPYLNGGLFDIKENDFYYQKLKFPKNFFDNLYSHFNEFNFTVDESSVDYEVVAVDPEMLGQIFESLLASQNKDKINERKKTGSYYTPRNIVDYMCKESIRKYLYNEINKENHKKGIDDLIDMTDAKFMERKSSSNIDLWGSSTKNVVSKIKKSLDNIKIIDPAVGSGAFPLGMLQIVSKLYERILPSSTYSSYDIKLKIIENNIYGVDLQPMAVEIAQLRAWLAIIVDDYQDNNKINPLPNLNFKFVSANSLVELDDRKEIFSEPKLEENLEKFRKKYFNAKTTKSKEVAQNEYSLITSQLEFFDDKRSEQLKTFDPFNNTTYASFYNSQYMFGVSNGFDVVIGNPPYIHFEDMEEEDRVFYKNLKYKTYASKGDIYSLFYEHGINLLKKGGILTYITSNKWMKAGYGKNLRNYLVENTNPSILIDLGEGIFENATVDTNILITTKEDFNQEVRTLKLGKQDIQQAMADESLKMNYKSDEVWTILNPAELSVKQKIEKLGSPLKEWNIELRYGIKTGLNDAFVITHEERNELIKSDPASEDLIKPLIRGKDIQRYAYNFKQLYLIISYFNSHKILEAEYPAIYEHLCKFETKLKERGQVKKTSSGKVNSNSTYPGQHHWLELDNNPSLEGLEDFNEVRIVWPDIAKLPRFALAEPNVFINDTSFMFVNAPMELIGFLNSKITEWYLPVIATDLGTSVRYKKQFVEKIPVPDYNENKQLYDEIKVYLESEEYHKIDELLFNFYGFSGDEKNILLS